LICSRIHSKQQYGNESLSYGTPAIIVSQNEHLVGRSLASAAFARFSLSVIELILCCLAAAICCNSFCSFSISFCFSASSFNFCSSIADCLAVSCLFFFF